MVRSFKAFAKKCRTEDECCELLEFRDGDSEAGMEDSELCVQEFSIFRAFAKG